MPSSSSARIEQVARHLSATAEPSTASAEPVAAVEPAVLLGARGAVRTVCLNRPKKLNTSDTDVVRLVIKGVETAEVDDTVGLVLVTGTGKHFCAGGDVVSLTKCFDKEEDWHHISEHWYQQFLCNHLLATCHKPIVSFMNGVTMGGGVGYSAHGAFRIVTETTQVAMPETKIGLFPDVGANFLYSRLDGELGTFLALTSTPLVGAGALFAGLASHYIPSSQLSAVEGRLSELSPRAATHKAVNDILNEFSANDEQLQAAFAAYPYQGPLRIAIDYCFSPSSIPAILSRLVELETGTTTLPRLSNNPADNASSLSSLQRWARETHAALRLRSPTSLTITLRALRLGRSSPLETVFARDVRLAIACCSPSHPDFLTGVDALLVKKLKPEMGQRPEWKPATVEEVDEEEVEKRYFADPLPSPGPELRVPDFEGYRRTRKSRGAKPYEDYVVSPHRRWALPTEEDVEAAMKSSTGGLRSMEDLRAELLVRWAGRKGVKEKVEEVWTRRASR